MRSRALFLGLLKLGSNFETGETGDGNTCVRENLRNLEFVIASVFLLQQRNLLDVCVDTTIHDLLQLRFRLTFIAADFGDDGARSERGGPE